MGYLISKFIGIKVASELQARHRTRGILLMVSIAAISWLLFAITPSPYNLIFLFLNGLPLGMVWSLVFGFWKEGKHRGFRSKPVGKFYFLCRFWQNHWRAGHARLGRQRVLDALHFSLSVFSSTAYIFMAPR